MSEKYGRENLRGLGYNWTDTTIEYVIGLKKEQFQKQIVMLSFQMMAGLIQKAALMNLHFFTV